MVQLCVLQVEIGANSVITFPVQVVPTSLCDGIADGNLDGTFFSQTQLNVWIFAYFTTFGRATAFFL
jgi:hypothetical protein